MFLHVERLVLELGSWTPDPGRDPILERLVDVKRMVSIEGDCDAAAAFIAWLVIVAKRFRGLGQADEILTLRTVCRLWEPRLNQQLFVGARSEQQQCA